jgi:hypothetical protein
LLISRACNQPNNSNNEEKDLKAEEQKIEYKAMLDEKIKAINQLNEKIKNELNKFVVCKVCKRKFANKTHMLRHTTMSELHKKNMHNLNLLINSNS